MMLNCLSGVFTSNRVADDQRLQSPAGSSIKYLPRIQNSLRIQASPQFAHHAHGRVADKFWEKTFFGQPDSVFAGNCPAKPHRLIEDLMESLLDPVHFLLVALVGQKRGMQ